MRRNRSNNLAVCIICGILTVWGIVASVISLIDGPYHWMVCDIICIVMSLLIGYYAFYGYRKPHGNLLKYIILLFSVTILISVGSMAQLGQVFRVVDGSIVIGILCFIAGRLHKPKQNIFLMIIVTALIVISKVLGLVYAPFRIGIFTGLIIWIDICVAYFLRYKAHREAGLMDAEDYRN